MAVAPRTVTHLRERSDALRPLSLPAPARLQRITPAPGRGRLALDGLQPDVGHAVRWVLRDCLSGAVRLARSLLSATPPDLAVLLRTVRQSWPVPLVGLVSDGHLAIRGAVAAGFPAVPHQLGHCHALREAAQPSEDADRQAKQERKKRGRGVRPLARRLAGRRAPAAAGVRGSCAAVRSALTDEGRPPLAASGLTLHDRLPARTARLERVAQRGAGPRTGVGCSAGWRGA
jgi:hypothetical protein